MDEWRGGSRLRVVCEEAARASFPPSTWGLEFVAAPQRTAGAVLAFTGHHIVAAGIDEDEVRRHLDPADIAAPFNPTFLAWLGRRLGAPVGHIDITMARLGSGLGDDWLAPMADPPESERVRRARRLRVELTYLAPPDENAVVMLGAGLAGRRELSMEITDEADRSQGLGTRVVLAAVARVPVDEAVFASVAPGNTRSFRCLVGAGFRPIGAECILSLP
jgi:ribosomal protein S18 acetylase RimI-like enzyme